MKRLLTATICLAALVAGCVKAPPRQPIEDDIPPPADWTTAALDGPPEPEWWMTFGDPDLPALIDDALAYNYDLRAAAARLERALAQARIAGADLKPAVGFNLDASRQRQNFIGFPIPGGGGNVLSTTTSRYGVSVETAWEVDLWGRLRAGARAAFADAQATEAELRGSRLSLAAQMAKAWFAVLETRQQLALAEETAASRQVTAGQIRTRYRQGLRPAVELRLALSNLATAKAVANRHRQSLEPAVRQVEVLLGRYPSGKLLASLVAGTLPDTPPPVPAGLPADLVGRRPDLVAAERRLAAADQETLVARRSLYPRLTLTGGGGTASDALEDLIDGDFRVWNLVAGLTQPLFQGGRLRAGVQAAEAGADEALAIYAASALQAYAEVESALAVEEFLAGEEQQLGEAARQLAAAQRLSEERYDRGVGDYLTVLESQTRAFVAQAAFLTVRRQRLENRIDLHLALGGGFES